MKARSFQCIETDGYSNNKLKADYQIINRSPLLKHQQSQLKRNAHANIFSAKYHMLPYVQHNNPMYNNNSEMTSIIPNCFKDSPSSALSQSKSMKIYDCILDKSKLIVKQHDDQITEGNYYKLNFEQVLKEDNFKKKDLILQKQQELIDQGMQIIDRKNSNNNKDGESVEGKKEYYNYIKDYSLRSSQGRLRTQQEYQKSQDSSFAIKKQEENQDFKGEQHQQQILEKIKEKQLEQFLQGDMIGYKNSLEKQLSQEAIVDSLKRQKVKKNNIRNYSPDNNAFLMEEGDNQVNTLNVNISQDSINNLESSEILLPSISQKEKRIEFRVNRQTSGRKRSINSREILLATSMKELDGQLGLFQKKVESQRQIRPWMNNNQNNKNHLIRSSSERKYQLNQFHGERANEQNRFQESKQTDQYGDLHLSILPKINYQNIRSEGKKMDTEQDGQEQSQEFQRNVEDSLTTDYSADKSVLQVKLPDGCSRLTENRNRPIQQAKDKISQDKQCYDFRFQPSYKFIVSQQ